MNKIATLLFSILFTFLVLSLFALLVFYSFEKIEELEQAANPHDIIRAEYVYEALDKKLEDITHPPAFYPSFREIDAIIIEQFCEKEWILMVSQGRREAISGTDLCQLLDAVYFPFTEPEIINHE